MHWNLLAAMLIAPAVSGAEAQTQWVLPDVQVPRVQRLIFASVAAKTNVSCFVWTPEHYDAEKDRRFPVLYWLHGTGGGSKGVPALAQHFGDAVRAGKIPPMIVIFPNGLATSMWCDSKDGRVPMETIVTKELVPEIDAKFRTIPAREARIIAGFSMGGYGAARLGFKRHDLFGGVSILAGGPLDLDFNGPRAAAKPQERDAILHDVFGDLDNFKSQSPLILAERNADELRGKMRIRMACGERDFTLELNRGLSQQLAKLDIKHTFTEVPGVGHKPMELLAGLGEAGWEFYRPAFGAIITEHVGRAATDLKLLFSTSQDVANVWGQIHFGATPMQKIRDCESPGFTVAHCMPMPEGIWQVFGQIMTRGQPINDQCKESNVWKLVRATTRDGVKFENVETVYQSEPAPWTDHLGLAWNPDAKEFLAVKLRMDNNGFAYRAFFSPEGRNWKEHPDRLFYDGDSMGLFWSPALRRFVCSNKTLQPWRKRLQDHGGTHPQNKDDMLRDRRVQAIRTSVDGRKWEPEGSLLDVWNRLGTYKPLPVEMMLTPDAGDPPDMEFYRAIGFWHHDRAFMVALNYAASPLAPRKHGPQLDTEWWVSDAGAKWERPFRGINALGDSFPGVPCITHNPMIIDGMMLFHFGNRIAGVKQDRISFVGARANGEFTTHNFTMPNGDLFLNAAIPSPDRPFATQQSYVMAAILDERGESIPGFTATNCIFQTVDRIDLAMNWSGKSARELAGRKICIRFHLRSANIYAVTTK